MDVSGEGKGKDVAGWPGVRVEGGVGEFLYENGRVTGSRVSPVCQCDETEMD